MEAVASNIEIVGSCNGLICLKDEKTLNIVIPFYSKVIGKVPFPAPTISVPRMRDCKFIECHRGFIKKKMNAIEGAFFIVPDSLKMATKMMRRSC